MSTGAENDGASYAPRSPDLSSFFTGGPESVALPNYANNSGGIPEYSSSSLQPHIRTLQPHHSFPQNYPPQPPPHSSPLQQQTHHYGLHQHHQHPQHHQHQQQPRQTPPSSYAALQQPFYPQHQPQHQHQYSPPQQLQLQLQQQQQQQQQQQPQPQAPYHQQQAPSSHPQQQQTQIQPQPQPQLQPQLQPQQQPYFPPPAYPANHNANQYQPPAPAPAPVPAPAPASTSAPAPAPAHASPSPASRPPIKHEFPAESEPIAAMPARKASQMSQETEIAPSPVKTKFPTARIKRIMQADEEVGKVAQQTPIAVGKALELFMVQLVTKSADVAKERNSKRISAQMLKQAIDSNNEWDFLRDIVSKVSEKEDTSRAGKAKVETESEEEVEPQPKKRRGGRKKKAES
ncbi:histone-fold-containing protein [Apiospora arundinis]|uniref:Histone-fold-containing protein n=1 Tax=Apiospora arundinis TaxID=335852 RepID=A0ABR2J6J1_9PEZI